MQLIRTYHSTRRINLTFSSFELWSYSKLSAACHLLMFVRFHLPFATLCLVLGSLARSPLLFLHGCLRLVAAMKHSLQRRCASRRGTGTTRAKLAKSGFQINNKQSLDFVILDFKSNSKSTTKLAKPGFQLKTRKVWIQIHNTTRKV